MTQMQEISRVAPEKVGAGRTAHEAAAETGVDNFLRLMRRELADPLGQVAELSARIEALRQDGFRTGTLTGDAVFAELSAAARRSGEMIERLIDMGEVLVGQSILTDERVMLAETLRSAARDLADTAHRRGVGIRLDDGRQILAPVYGSSHWLATAMRHLLALSIDAAPPGAHVLLRLRQIGFHQLVAGSVNHNPAAPATLDLLQGTAKNVKAEIAAAKTPAMLDLAMARAIVELLGGALKIDIAGNDVLNGFHLTLPTGESQAQRQRPDCGNCPHLRQAEEFAQDIGELLNALQAGQRNPIDGDRK